MERLASERGWRRGVELGVGTGLLRARLLALGIHCIGVDMGKRPERRAEVDQLGGTMLWMPTSQAAPYVPDGWADFVFIDAAHSYTAVKDDIARWRPKVKPGGWFGGHDYHPSHPGVMQAVDEAFPARILHPGWVWEAA